MNSFSVYKLINSKGEVEYIGETKRPKQRFTEHLKYPSNSGKFIGRNDLEMEVIATFDNKKEAWEYQVSLQKQYGFTTDRDKLTRLHSIETKQKIGLSSKGRWTNRKHSEESIEKMKEAKRKYWELKKQNK